MVETVSIARSLSTPQICGPQSAAFAISVGVARLDLTSFEQYVWFSLAVVVTRRGAGLRSSGSAHRLLHQRDDPCLFGGGQLLEREGGRPHGAFVEVRLVAEAERRVPRFELLRALEEADDIAVLGIRGHPVPGSRREGWRAGFDEGMEPLGYGAIRLRHLGDLREHVAFPFSLLLVRARFRLLLFGALLHRCSFLVRESLGLLHAHRSLLCGLSHVLLRQARKIYLRVRALTSRFLIGLLTCFTPQEGIPSVARRLAPIDAGRHTDQLGEASAEGAQRRVPISARDAHHRCWTRGYTGFLELCRHEV